MKEYSSLTPRETAKRLLGYKNPVVIMHVRPDGDTIGSAIALIRIFRLLGIEAEYACADEIPERLAFIIQDEKRAESLDERELIAIDVASKAQLGSLSEYAEKISLTIDHHKVNSPFSDNLTVADASSAAEALYSVFSELADMGKCALTSEVAYPIYTAISSDTGGFVFSSASAKAYRLAASLIETGIDFADINHRLFHSKSKEHMRAEGFIASSVMTDAEGRIAYAILSAEDRASLGLKSEHFETAIDVIRSVKDAEIAIFVKENDDKTLKASMRSTGFNVAEIAAEFGGGGHVRAAGCAPTAKNAHEGARLLIERIKNKL